MVNSCKSIKKTYKRQKTSFIIYIFTKFAKIEKQCLSF